MDQQPQQPQQQQHHQQQQFQHLGSQQDPHVMSNTFPQDLHSPKPCSGLCQYQSLQTDRIWNFVATSACSHLNGLCFFADMRQQQQQQQQQQQHYEDMRYCALATSIDTAFCFFVFLGGTNIRTEHRRTVSCGEGSTCSLLWSFASQRCGLTSAPSNSEHRLQATTSRAQMCARFHRLRLCCV